MTTTRSAHAPRREQQLPSWMPGLAAGGIAGVAAHMTSLVPRKNWQSWAATAVCAAAGFGIGAGTNSIANALDRHSDGLNQTSSKLLVSGAGVATALAATVALHGSSSTALRAVRNAGLVAAGAGVVGLGVQGERSFEDKLGRTYDTGTAGAIGSSAAGLAAGALEGVAIVGGAAALLGRTRASAVTPEVAAAYEAEMRSEIPAAAVFDAKRWAQLATERARMTTISGGANSLLPRASLNKDAARFVDLPTTLEEIARVMGASGTAIKAPVRVYGGFHHAASHQELADKMLAETKRLGGFDRSHIVLYVPSGSGNINQQAVMSLEYLKRGDVSSVAMQYGELPSVKSVQKVPDAAKLFDTVRETFAKHIASLPPEKRPTMSAFSESLGSWAIQDAVRAHGGSTKLNEMGLSGVFNVGTPGFSKLREEAIGQQGRKLDPTGTLVEFGLPSEYEKYTSEEQQKATTVLFSHYDDAVNRANFKTLIVRPPWLANRADGKGIPAAMKWQPGVTGVHAIFDLINGISSGPGRAHNYGANMAHVSNLVYRTKASGAQVGGINDAVEQLRLFEDQPVKV